jgi:ABC-type microcin C transport system permease subunit YejB
MASPGGGIATRLKDITDTLRGSLILLTLWGTLIGILAAPIYLTATFVDGLGVSAWSMVLLCVGAGIAEFCLAILILRRLDRRDESMTPS